MFSSTIFFLSPQHHFQHIVASFIRLNYLTHYFSLKTWLIVRVRLFIPMFCMSSFPLFHIVLQINSFSYINVFVTKHLIEGIFMFFHVPMVVATMTHMMSLRLFLLPSVLKKRLFYASCVNSSLNLEACVYIYI